MAFVRSSKYRHVFGTPSKKDQCYDNIRVSKNNWDGNFCAVNAKFIAIITESSGGGSFLVLRHDETGRVDLNHPQVAGHKANVLDLAWNPFNDNIIASGSDDLSVKIWHIPDEGIQDEPLIDPVVDLQYHQKRVGQVMWHPTASNILLSIGHDNVIAIWNAEQGAVVTEITCHPELVQSASWNYDGSLIATTCKDKKIRIIDPRTGEVKKEGSGHGGSKIARVQFLKNKKIFTTGFSRMSERQYAVWDSDLNQVAMETIDNNNAPLTIHYDPDINLIYLIGKGDSLFRYYEIVDDKPWACWLNNYQSNVPQRCCGFIPKRSCNVNACEIAKIYKIIPKGTCEPISMVVPRKSDLFQDDIYPDTAGEEPALTADEWLSGKNKDPILVSLSEGYVSTRARSEVKTQAGKPNMLANLSKKTSAAPAVTAAAPKSSPAANQSASTNGTTTPTSQPPTKVSDSSPPKVEDKPAPVTAKPKPEPLTAKPKVEKRQEEDGVVELKGALTDLSSTVEKHEARIAALEELSHGQNKEINELKSEVDKLKELVKKQEDRIAALESKVAN